MNNETKTIAFLIADIQCMHKKMEVLRNGAIDEDLYWYSQLLNLQFMATDAIRNARMEVSKDERDKLDKALGASFYVKA